MQENNHELTVSPSTSASASMVAISMAMASLANTIKMFHYTGCSTKTTDFSILIGCVTVTKTAVFSLSNTDLVVSGQAESLFNRTISSIAGFDVPCELQRVIRSLLENYKY